MVETNLEHARVSPTEYVNMPSLSVISSVSAAEALLPLLLVAKSRVGSGPIGGFEIHLGSFGTFGSDFGSL